MINLDKEEAILFAPEPNPLYQIFMVIYEKADYHKMYNLKTEYTKDLEKYIEDLKPVF